MIQRGITHPLPDGKGVLKAVIPICVVLALLSASGCGVAEREQQQVQDDLGEAAQNSVIWNIKEMHRWCDNAIAVDPNNADTYAAPIDSNDTDDLNINEICVLNSDFRSDEYYMQQAVAKFPNHIEPLYALMQAQDMLGEPSAEQQTASQLVKILEAQVAKGNISENKLTCLADAYWAAGNHPKSIATYNRVFNIYPADSEPLNNLAYMYAVANDRPNLQQALTLATQAVAKARQNTSPDSDTIVGSDVDTLGWVQYRLGDYNSALNSATEAVQDDPRQPEIRYHLGMIYLALGNKPAAQVEFGHAAQIAPDYADAKTALAELNSTTVASPSGATVPPTTVDTPSHA